MARHRTHPVAFKRQIVQEYLSGEVGLNTLAKRHRHLDGWKRRPSAWASTVTTVRITPMTL